MDEEIHLHLFFTQKKKHMNFPGKITATKPNFRKEDSYVSQPLYPSFA
ncbi:hypothetical protein [Vagococcus vulneris]|nr:hypothetical protein [Vagococcus vulneris]